MKICIIKLGADGDVLRTLPLAKALEDKHPTSEIIWITKGDISTLINNLPYIDKVVTIPYSTKERFDVLYNFDTEEAALNLAVEIDADKKYGFYADGRYPAVFNTGAEYYLNTIFDDELKKKNKKTYQEMMFEAAELHYKKERYEIRLNEEEKMYAQDYIKRFDMKGKKIIGIHMGASSRWPSKVWHEERVKEFIVKMKKKGHEILLFGGPNEVEQHDALANELSNEGIEIYRNNPKNTKREFAALVSLCDYVVCSDSFALHVALGLGKKTIGLFFVTSPDEVEDYGLLTKIISPKLKEFFPERSNEYNEELVKSISSDEVAAAISALDLKYSP